MLTKTLKALRTYFSAEARMGRALEHLDLLADAVYGDPSCFSEDELVSHCGKLAEDYGHHPVITQKLLSLIERAANHGQAPYTHARELALTIANGACAERSEGSINASARLNQDPDNYEGNLESHAQTDYTDDDIREALEKAAAWIWRDILLSDFEAEIEKAGNKEFLKHAAYLRYQAECITRIFSNESGYWVGCYASQAGKTLEAAQQNNEERIVRSALSRYPRFETQ